MSNSTNIVNPNQIRLPKTGKPVRPFTYVDIRYRYHLNPYSIDKLVESHGFPKPHRIDNHTVGFDQAAVLAWFAAREDANAK
jgi:hypothetical protein